MLFKNNKLTIKNIFSKMLLGTLSAVIILGATSCGDTSWALQVDGEKLPAGIYLLNQNRALQEAKQNDDFDAKLKNMWDNKIDDKSLDQWVTDETKVLTKRYAQVEKLFKEKKLELTKDELKSLEENTESMWQYMSKTYEELGISKESYAKIMENTFKESALFKSVYGEKGEKAVSNDEIKKYYNENYLKVNIAPYLTVDSSTGKAISDEEKKKLEEKAKADLKRIQDGENIKTIIAERNKATTPSDDKSDTKEEVTEESTQMEIRKSENASISDKLASQIFEKTAGGKTELLSDENGFYIVKSYETKLSDEELKTKKDSILSQYKYEEFEKYLDEKAKDLSVKENNNAINTFKAKKWEKK